MFPTIQNSIVAGELTPAVYGRTDLAKWHSGAATLRNNFVDYRGGYKSRAGTAYVGMCKQSGDGAPPRDITFQFNIDQGFALEFGDQYMRIKSNGAYVIETGFNITGANHLTPPQILAPGNNFSVGDWVFITGMQGETYFNGLTWIVASTPSAGLFTVTDLFGNAIDPSGFGNYIGGGTVSRIYTVVSPYAAVDLPYLKFTQSANTMSLTCVNVPTLTEYPPYDLQRLGPTNWVFTQATFGTNINPPGNVDSTAANSTTKDTFYAYVVTAIDASTGQESVASNGTLVENNDIAINAGSNTITWDAATGASSYNIYKTTPSYSVGVPVGVPYGFAGTSLGGSFVDTNITADFDTTPPTHTDPFAQGAIELVNITNQGSDYSNAISYIITTSTGSGFSGRAIEVGGKFTAFLIDTKGKNYRSTDTITITDSDGSGATATLTVGPLTGTYPGAVAYFQQRRVYASTLNEPDTYFMSQPGNYLNFDASLPVQDDDSITGTPWAQQINGIQFMVPMPGGLVVLTGKGAWQLNGGQNAAITPADQTATPQAYNGCSAIVPPVVVNYDILYVQSKGSIVRDLSYNFFTNIYTGTDMTVLSNHLFDNYQILQWAWAEEPFKIVWAIRNDGTLLSFTYLKEQDVYAWARHDTNGLYVGVTSVTEPPVDAVYLIVRRFVQGGWRYYSERMNNRDWPNVEACFCVDAGLTYPMPAPNATLQVSASSGNVTLSASSNVFTAQSVGSIVRAGGGKITVTGFTSGTLINGIVTQALTATIPNDPNLTPAPVTSGSWTITAPTSIVTGLNHLEGLTVAILADGSVVPNQVVANGGITLPHPCSAITVGLPYLPQFQSMYLDPAGQPVTVQGKRKNVYAVTVRMEASRGMQVGTNQPDASVQPNNATIPWTNMKEFKERNARVNAGTSIPLFTGDERINVPANWDTRGQVAIQQMYPLPMNVLAIIPEYQIGDTSG